MQQQQQHAADGDGGDGGDLAALAALSVSLPLTPAPGGFSRKEEDGEQGEHGAALLPKELAQEQRERQDEDKARLEAEVWRLREELELAKKWNPLSSPSSSSASPFLGGEMKYEGKEGKDGRATDTANTDHLRHHQASAASSSSSSSSSSTPLPVLSMLPAEGPGPHGASRTGDEAFPRWVLLSVATLTFTQRNEFCTL